MDGSCMEAKPLNSGSLVLAPSSGSCSAGRAYLVGTLVVGFGAAAWWVGSPARAWYGTTCNGSARAKCMPDGPSVTLFIDLTVACGSSSASGGIRDLAAERTSSMSDRRCAHRFRDPAA